MEEMNDQLCNSELREVDDIEDSKFSSNCSSSIDEDEEMEESNTSSPVTIKVIRGNVML